MKESTNPIKRSPALVHFSREHHFGLLLVWKIRQGINNNTEHKRIAEYIIFFFEKDLKAHFNAEEDVLFVKLPIDDPLRIQAFDEHNRIYKLIEALQNDTLNNKLILQFADLLDSHIRFEERVLFNHLQQKLSNEELVKLEEMHRKRDFDVDKLWNDHFWLNKK